MERPLLLQLIPSETFPTSRPHSSPPVQPVLPVQDMAQMATFVYDFYIQKVQAMKSAFYVSKQYYKIKYCVITGIVQKILSLALK